MTSIVFTAEGADAQAEVNGKLTAGMVGVRIRFELDEAWKGLNVIATFEGSGALISVPLLSYMEGAVPLNVQAYRVIDTDVPWEVLQKQNTRLRIGLEGRLVDGTIVIPTVWARAGYIEAGALATGEEANQPTPGIYDQIMAAIEAGKLQGEPGDDGVSPTVSVTEIEGGHRVTITDANGTQVFDVMDGSGFDIKIADDLYTKDSTKALSANMGAVLREKIDTDLLGVQKELQAEIKQRVKTVNGVAPDENGNVNVDGGGNGGGIAVETDPTVPAWAKQPNKPTYTASEVGALPASTVIPTVPTKVSAFENDKGYLTGYTETDPTVPAWAKASSKPSYSKSEVGLGNVDNVKQYSASNPPPYPVTSVNGETGAVTLDASAVGARPSTWMPSASDVGALPASTTIPTKVSQLDNDKGYLTQHQDISGKLDASALPSAINTALAQAKASGEFDGKNGDTPVRGVDYWTTADKAEIEAHIATELAKRGQLAPEFAESLEWLEANGDQSKMYVLPDGMIYAWMLTRTEVSGPSYTNVLPTAKDTDGTIFNGIGYKNSARWSSSSNSVTSGAATQGITGFIPCKNDDVVRVKGYAARASNAWYIISFNASKGVLKSFTPYNSNVSEGNIDNGEFGIRITESQYGSGVAFVRFSIGAFTENSIITVNEEISETGRTEIVEEWAWGSTGHAFIPADYEDRIVEVENRTLRHTAEISALQKMVESGSADETEAAALKKIKVWDKPVYDYAPLTLISDDRAKPALSNSEKTVEAVYAKYRALMAKYPEYITEINLGLSSSSDTFAAVDMLRFDFKEPDGRVETGYVLNETKPKIIFMTGVHNEYAGIYGLYYALEEIAENPEFRDIRRNAHIIVIPCSNPHCLGGATAVEGWTMSHVNANGVAIHNNFGVEFSKTNASATLGAYNYGGTEPYSEPETQYIDKVMRENLDAIAFVSCHNFNYGIKFASDFVWMSSATAHMCNLCFRLIDKLTTAWMDKYGDTYTTNFDAYRDTGTETYANGDYRIGRATISTSAGTEQLNATKYGILGANLEIGDRIRVVSGNTTYTSETMTHGAEVYANFMRTLLWNYDHKDKKEYAPNLPWSE